MDNINLPPLAEIPVPPPPKPSLNSKRNLIKWGLIIIIAILFSSGATYFLLKPKLTKRIISQTLQQSVPQLSPTSTLDETVNWKTYINDRFEFSFKYPEVPFKWREESDSSVYLAPSAGQGGSGPKFLNPGDVWLNAGVEPFYLLSPESAEEFFNKNKETYTNAQKIPVTIGGSSGYKVIYDFPAVAGNMRTYNYEGLILRSNLVYIRITLSAWDSNSLQKYEKTFDQILSTFIDIIDTDRRNKKTAALELVNAIIRYYVDKGVMPWSASGDNCNGGVAPNATLVSNFTTCLTTLENQGELKTTFKEQTAILQKLYVTGGEKIMDPNTIFVCYDPESKTESLRPMTKYNNAGAVQTGCPAADATCYWCAQ